MRKDAQGKTNFHSIQPLNLRQRKKSQFLANKYKYQIIKRDTDIFAISCQEIYIIYVHLWALFIDMYICIFDMYICIFIVCKLLSHCFYTFGCKTVHLFSVKMYFNSVHLHQLLLTILQFDFFLNNDYFCFHVKLPCVIAIHTLFSAYLWYLSKCIYVQCLTLKGVWRQLKYLVLKKLPLSMFGVMLGEW